MTTDRDSVFTSIKATLSPETIERLGVEPLGPNGNPRHVAQVVTRICCALAEAEEKLAAERRARMNDGATALEDEGAAIEQERALAAQVASLESRLARLRESAGRAHGLIDGGHSKLCSILTTRSTEEIATGYVLKCDCAYQIIADDLAEALSPATQAETDGGAT